MGEWEERRMLNSYIVGALFICWMITVSLCSAESSERAIVKDHPRLLGSRDHLQKLAKERATAYQRMERVAREQKADDHAKMISMALVCAVEQDENLGKAAVEMAMKYINGPIRVGHVTFAHDLARCAIVYDLCHEYWTPEQRAQFLGNFNENKRVSVEFKYNF